MIYIGGGIFWIETATEQASGLPVMAKWLGDCCSAYGNLDRPVMLVGA